MRQVTNDTDGTKAARRARRSPAPFLETRDSVTAHAADANRAPMLALSRGLRDHSHRERLATYGNMLG